MLRTVFDVPALNARKLDLEQIAAQPDFWNDQQKAKKQMRLLDEVRDQLNKLIEWQNILQDARAVLELNNFEQDDELLTEAQNGLNKLEAELDLWELERLLTVSYTHLTLPTKA